MLRWPIRSKQQRPFEAAWVELPHAALEMLTIAAHRRVATAQTGPQLRRRMGHSLDFREHRGFVPGDDIRHVDWRASARMGAEDNLLVRLFDAEEQMTVLVLLDLRPTMGLPDVLQKAALAALTCRALAWTVENGRNRFVLQPFGLEEPCAPLDVRGSGISARVDAYLDDVLDRAARQDPAQSPSEIFPPWLLGQRSPGVVFVLSDFYFDDPLGILESFARNVQRRYGFFFAVEFDSWPVEAAMLADGAVEIEAVEGLAARPYPSEVNDDILSDARAASLTHVQALLNRMDYGGMARVHWELDPQAVQDPAAWLEAHLAASPDLGNALENRI